MENKAEEMVKVNSIFNLLFKKAETKTKKKAGLMEELGSHRAITK